MIYSILWNIMEYGFIDWSYYFVVYFLTSLCMVIYVSLKYLITYFLNLIVQMWNDPLTIINGHINKLNNLWNDIMESDMLKGVMFYAVDSISFDMWIILYGIYGIPFHMALVYTVTMQCNDHIYIHLANITAPYIAQYGADGA